ncbi:MAG: tail fiber domain-containing protein, partial [Bacteroidota bacterium]
SPVSYEATRNTAVGFSGLSANTTGFTNSAFGTNAMLNNTTGFNNTACGAYALPGNLDGFYNVAVGDQALLQNTSGARNTAVGHFSMLGITTGNYNTAIGAYIDFNSNAIENSTCVGNDANINASNSIAVGNTSISSIKGQVNFTTYSDARVKRNVQENVPGLNFINALRPVTYNYDIHKENELIGNTLKEDWAGRYDIEKITFTGFIAQEVDAAAKKTGYDFSGVDKSENLIGLRYSEFVVPIVKSVQELSAASNEIKNTNDALAAKVNQLEKENKDMKAAIEQMQNDLSHCCMNFKSGINSTGSGENINDAAKLEQNTPNPFSEKTIISYYVPKNVTNAVIKIYSATGIELKSVNISSKGFGQSEIKAGTLAAGTYTYMLMADGKTVDTKQMVLTR